jgi:hypothetical protein
VDATEAERADEVGTATRALRRHPRLAAVRPEQLTSRDLSKLANSLRRQGDPCCRLALELRRRLACPVPPGVMGRFGDDDVNNHLGVLITAADAMTAHGLVCQVPVVTDDGVCIGPLAFRRGASDRSPALWFGPHRVRFAQGIGSRGGEFDGCAWVVDDASSTRAVLATVVDDLRPPERVDRVA